MLFARAISNGVKWFCPDVFAGPVYTPEEMANDSAPQPETIDVTHTVVVEPNAERIEEIRAQLLAATNNDELAAAYKALTKPEQKEWAEFVKKLKAGFDAETTKNAE